MEERDLTVSCTFQSEATEMWAAVKALCVAQGKDRVTTQVPSLSLPFKEIDSASVFLNGQFIFHWYLRSQTRLEESIGRNQEQDCPLVKCLGVATSLAAMTTCQSLCR